MNGWLSYSAADDGVELPPREEMVVIKENRPTKEVLWRTGKESELR
jgi:hypothetical protein